MSINTFLIEIFEIISGDIEVLQNLLIDGYDHILDIKVGDPIAQVAETRGHANIAKFLESIPEFEVIPLFIPNCII